MRRIRNFARDPRVLAFFGVYIGVIENMEHHVEWNYRYAKDYLCIDKLKSARSHMETLYPAGENIYIVIDYASLDTFAEIWLDKEEKCLVVVVLLELAKNMAYKTSPKEDEIETTK